MAFIETPRLQHILDGRALATAEEGEIHTNLIFYVLNTVFEIYQAKESGLMEAEAAIRLMRGQAVILKPHAAEIERIFDLRRGYDAGFCAFVRGVVGSG